MKGEYGFCGYFKEFDHDFPEDERLKYAKDERPPPYDPLVQPKAPAAEWDEARLAKAYRNYAVELFAMVLRLWQRHWDVSRR